MIARPHYERSGIVSPSAAAQPQVPRQNALMYDVDVGYDTDTIAEFEIDKSFTDYLLCQICFSKYPPSNLFVHLT